ncbi:MAG: molybdenum cofactor biosynthesis protein MoaE [Gemmatimonadota bacterium]|jgi:molybdopterin synthase catalytic subunit|nr:molybdenum cofactor biosynthesis protein MoaE [Gemmatimonadota bacterium]
MSDAVDCRVTPEPLDTGALLRGVADSSDGAVLLFVGVVRQQNEGRAVTHLEYEAYAPMAEAKLREICREARERWRTGRVCAVHRVGRLEIGEASVAIAVAAPHRGDAYEASRYVIEELKRRVPVWKREGYVDGPSEWLAGVTPGGEPG